VLPTCPSTQRLDAIAFTSKAQVERLFKVAAEHDRGQALAAALAELVVAAVGPVVAAELAGHEIGVDVVPESNFFMKPLVNRLLERLAVG
jgi:uroporphyrinogen-III synthase